MGKIRGLLRLTQLLKTIARYRLYDLVPGELPMWLKVVLKGLAGNNQDLKDASPEKRLRLAMQTMGPVMVKFGQALSTRRDLFSAELINELSLLQDKVAPFPSDQAIRVIEDSLGQSIKEVFAHFETEAMAAASIAQVHAAQLKDGRDVVVKVLRPGVEEAIARDIQMLYTLAALFNQVYKEAPRFRMIESVREFEQNLSDELDLQREAANAALMRRNFIDSEILRIPQVHFDYTRQRVMVQERIYGLACTDVDKFKDAGVDLSVLAKRAVEIAFTQIFRDNFFHADMHPGNIFVDISHPSAPSYIAVDFGIVGSLTDHDREYLSETLLGFFQQDYHRVAKIHIDRGWVAADTRISDFEGAIRTISEPIFEKPLSEISFGLILVQVLKTTQRFQMQAQPSLLLLEKTLFQIEGLGRQIYPELDLWQTAKPILEDWDRKRRGPSKLWQEFKLVAPHIAAKLPSLPQHALDAVEQVSQTSARQVALQNEVTALRVEMSYQGKQRKRQTLAAILVMVGLAVPIMTESVNFGPSWVLFALALVILLTEPKR